MATLWWFSEPVWQTLPTDIQNIIHEGFKKQQAAANNLVATQEENSYLIFEQAGGTVYRPTESEKQAFKDASQNMRGWFISKFGTEWLDVLETSVASCESST
jgi:TRAP-type C4-dicarboxylate transport system substrate-binding protein